MSQKCPRCRLFSPKEAIRCDCGYDFETRDVQSSYLYEHVVQKHGGEENLLEKSARSNFLNGGLLLAVVVVMSAMTYVAGGGAYLLGWPAVSGIVLLIRGLRQRRERQGLIERAVRTKAKQKP